MPLYLERRASGIYRVRGSYLGVRVARSTKTRDRAIADGIRQKWEEEIKQKVVFGKAPAVSFARAAIDYMNAGGERRYLDPVIERLGLKDVDSLRQSDLDAAARDAYPNAKSSTLNRQFYTPFIAVMTLAAENDLCDRRTWRRPKQPEGRMDWRTPQEIELVFAHLSPRSRCLGEFLVGAFPRISEAIGMLHRDVSPGAIRAIFWNTKGGYARHVDLPQRSRLAVLEALSWSEDPDGRLWRTERRNRPWADRNGFRQALGRACEHAGVKPFGPHTLRRTGATWRYAVEGDLPRLMAAGGWKSFSMAQRYIHAGTDDLAGAVKDHGWTIGVQSSPDLSRKILKQ